MILDIVSLEFFKFSIFVMFSKVFNSKEWCILLFYSIVRLI